MLKVVGRTVGVANYDLSVIRRFVARSLSRGCGDPCVKLMRKTVGERGRAYRLIKLDVTIATDACRLQRIAGGISSLGMALGILKERTDPALPLSQSAKTRLKEFNMKYATIRYEKSEGERTLILHSFDGTSRSVEFRSEEEMAFALMTGRAEADCVAVQSGMLPRGATLVSSASAVDPSKVLTQIQGAATRSVDPLAVVRLAFSQKILADRSTFIDEARDATARQDHSDDARRYELLVDAVRHANEAGGMF